MVASRGEGSVTCSAETGWSSAPVGDPVAAPHHASASFRRYRAALSEVCTEPPTVTHLGEVGWRRRSAAGPPRAVPMKSPPTSSADRPTTFVRRNADDRILA